MAFESVRFEQITRRAIQLNINILEEALILIFILDQTVNAVNVTRKDYYTLTEDTRHTTALRHRFLSHWTMKVQL